MKRIIVVGANWLATAFAEAATSLGFSVLGIAPRSRPENWPAAAEHKELNAGKDAKMAMLAFAPEILVHMGADLSPRGSWRGSRRQAVQLFSQAVDLGVPRIICWSSVRYYGPVPGRTLPLRELDPPIAARRGRLGAAAADLEAGLEPIREKGSAEVVVLRAAPLPLVSDDPLARLLVGRIVPRVAGFDPPLQFLHPNDAVGVLLHAVSGALPGTYNVAGDGVMLYSEVCRATGRPTLPLVPSLWKSLLAIGVPVGLPRVPEGTVEEICHSLVVDNSRLKTHFGYRPGHDSRQALARLLHERQLSRGTPTLVKGSRTRFR